MYCGLLCKTCSGTCSEAPTESRPLELQCVFCNGDGCDQCENGYIRVSQCPRMELGRTFTKEMRLVNHAMQDKLMPNAGGVNDQPARFINLWQSFRGDVAMIEREEAKRAK